MKDEKNKITSWQDKRINEINRISKEKRYPSSDINPYFDEVQNIYVSKANTYEDFVLEQKEKTKEKEKESLINRKKWREEKWKI
tara:strand:- start:318 stop:569 length:252 start_codon:yes stop_codon:yes gene_type:complete